VIGREEETARVTRLLRRADVRLVTLTGPGGIGKTSLALEIAAQVAPEFADGVVLVRLETIDDAHLVGPMIAQAVGFRVVADRSPWESLREFLHDRRLLLVLDNFEQVLEAAGDVADLLGSCPTVKVLATSRIPLHAAGEHEYLVPPLRFAKLIPGLSATEAIGSAAAELFVERARSVRAGFTVTEANARSIARICQQLDGIPLAIELAASLVKALPVDSLADRLAASFRLLARPGRLGQARQQTLQATFDWSYNLLSDRERALFRRLAVFAGGFTLEAAEAVCRDERGLVPTDQVVSLLVQLVDKSLVVSRENHAGVNYDLLQPIRQYGWERLEEAGELRELRDRHLAWCLDLAEPAERELLSMKQPDWIATLEAERANLRVALTWGIESRSLSGVRLAGYLWFYWYAFEEVSEGYYWGELMLQQPTDDRFSRAKTMLGLSFILRDSEGSFARARLLAEDSLSVFQTCGDRRLCGWALHNLGMIHENEGRLDQARMLLEESIAEFRAAADDGGVGASLRDLSKLLRHRGDDKGANAALEESLQLLRRVGDCWNLSFTLQESADLAVTQRDLTRARQLGNEALSRTLESSKVHAGFARRVLARIARAEGNHLEARDHLVKGLILHRIGAFDLQTWDCLQQFGVNALDRQALATGVRLMAAAHSHLPDSYVDPSATAELTPVRSRLGDEAYDRAWAAGQAMSLEQAVADALEEDGD
jgi:non-specific serine/threonine protein kinase